MSLVYKDFVRETTSTTGTGTYSLAGPITNHQSFVAGIGSGHQCTYAARDQSGNGWEVGIGTVTAGSPNTLSRDTILSSSNGGAAVSWSSGTRDIYCTMAGERIIDTDSISFAASQLAFSNSSGNGLTSDPTLFFNTSDGSLHLQRIYGVNNPSTGAAIRLRIWGAPSTSGHAAGTVTLTGGASPTVDGDAGFVWSSGGSVDADNGNGGDITLTPGYGGAVSGNAGSVNISGQDMPGTGTPSNVTIYAGAMYDSTFTTIDPSTSASIFLQTGGVTQLQIDGQGAWNLPAGAGSAGQFMLSGGSTAAPSWGGPTWSSNTLTLPRIFFWCFKDQVPTSRLTGIPRNKSTTRLYPLITMSLCMFTANCLSTTTGQASWPSLTI